MDRPDPPNYEVQASVHDTPWRSVGKAWVNEDGSVFIQIDGEDRMLMLVQTDEILVDKAVHELEKWYSCTTLIH
jgi:hypothetical protein